MWWKSHVRFLEEERAVTPYPLLFDNYSATSEEKWPIIYTIKKGVTVLHAGKIEQKRSSRKNNRANNISRAVWRRYTSCLEPHRDSIYSYT
jgi:hypothetical protein